MASEIEDKMLSLYAHGSSYEQIREFIEDFYDVDFSKGAFPNDNSLLKLLFMGIKNAQKK